MNSAPLFNLTDLTDRVGLEREGVLVMRHVPIEKLIRQALPDMVENEPDLFRAYQAFQYPHAEAALAKATTLLAFIGEPRGLATFARAYTVTGSHLVTLADYLAEPENQQLIAMGMLGQEATRPESRRFDLQPRTEFADLCGRLVLRWPKPERNWYRWLASPRNTFEVAAIELRSRFERPPGSWRDVKLTWPQLNLLSPARKVQLGEWRGVYFIFDSARKLGYVGSACGEENILGRWHNYAVSGHGGNKGLRASNPQDLLFSILELVAPTASSDDVLGAEANWKGRLSTRAPSGLNEN